jgi:D-3-phosphoglycerate dehydrogenase
MHLYLLTYTVLMAVARNVGDASQSIKAGKWERSRLVGVEAKGKTLAIVGLGKGKNETPTQLQQN